MNLDESKQIVDGNSSGIIILKPCNYDEIQQKAFLRTEFLILLISRSTAIKSKIPFFYKIQKPDDSNEFML